MKQGTIVNINCELGVCTIVGIAFDCRPSIGSIYVVKPLSGEHFNGYETVCMSDACLRIDYESINTGRNFVGIEQEPKYFEIAKKRIQEASK